ncbi:hypothetical protein KYJ26_10610 [Bacillus sp. MCCB 382]|uniref:hypothetical protein n=1 Tax=Bacillus sp. MCCB 382 TaxID=2860197 RepID=UPI001C598C0F|nr:hypothetical protein [Bacillus sp. MCCB 382]
MKTQDLFFINEKEGFTSEIGKLVSKWSHVFKDELNHRGQIRMITKRLKNN